MRAGTALGQGQALGRLRGLLTPTTGAYLALLALLVASAVASPAFLRPDNLVNIARQAVPLGIVALGETIVILVGGLDVSVGAVITLTTAVTASVMASSNARVLPTVALVLAIGLAVGAINGVLVAVLRADPFVTTLASMLILRGATLVYTQGAPRSNLTPGFREISEGDFLGLPISLYAFSLLFLAAWFALRRTVWGRRVYAVGANVRAARLSGQPTMRVEISAYVLCSLLAAVAGLFLVARLGSGDVNAGSGFELNAIAAALIGGTAFGGGRGGVAGTLAGVLVMTTLINLVSLLALPNFVQLIVRGVVVVLGVALYSRRSSART